MIDPIATISSFPHDLLMKAIFSSIALFVGGACSEQPSDEEAFIHVIESAVELPAGARALKDYSRNYAMRPDGRVIGIYVIPQPAEDYGSDYVCQVMLENFTSRPCTKAEEAENAKLNGTMADMLGQAGPRWVNDYRNLPVISDGGCDVIEIIFEPRSKRIESTFCNGGGPEGS